MNIERDHEVNTKLSLALRVCKRGHSSTSCLQDQRNQIARDEKARNESRGEPGQTMSIDGDNAGEAEVDSGREEGRANG